MKNEVISFIDKHKLLKNNELYIVALSGGADSVALLLMLHEAGYKVHAAHCNFHLRGEESDRDEAFCMALCERLGVELHRIHFDTKTYAEVHKMGIEKAARELRYGYFEQLRKDAGAAGICVAHHRDDSVETVLMNLLRGSGLRGLTGIKPKNGYVLRPLLCVSRAEIEAYLAAKGQEYVADSTNLVPDVLRNKIRLQVLPLLRELNPAAVENIQRTAENLSEAQAVLDVQLEELKNHNTLDISQKNILYSSEYFVFEWLKNYGFNGKLITKILEAETGRVFTSPTGYDLLVDRGRLLVEPSLKPFKKVVIPEEGTYVFEENRPVFDENRSVFDENRRLIVKKTSAYISKNADLATIDADKVCFPLTLRRVEEGDWMVPFGMKGRKVLSDLMTDRKMSLFEKRRQLLVVDAQGVIVWAVGLRTDARVAVSKASETVLELSVK